MSQKVGFTCGSYDLLHLGHVRMFEDCKKHCEYLIVAVLRTPSSKSNKTNFIQSSYERAEMIKALSCVDHVITYADEAELLSLLTAIDYQIRFLGSDWKGKTITGSDIPGHLEKCYYHNRDNHGWSSTELKQRIVDASKVKTDFLT